MPDQNSRFRSLGVRSGDILKYYVIEDETVDEERRASGFSRRLAMEFNIAQVVDENTLLIEKGVPASIARDYLRQVGQQDGALPQEVKDYIAQAVADDSTVIPQIVIPAKIEIWRNLDDRLFEINQQLSLYWERRLPPLGWEPSPDQKVLAQIVVWLNQWLRQSERVADWRIDPLLESLDTKLRNDPQLAAVHFQRRAGSRRFRALRRAAAARGRVDARHFALGPRRQLRRFGTCRRTLRLDRAKRAACR